MSHMSTHDVEGMKREERLGELRNVGRPKRALTTWRGGRGGSGLVSFDTWHVTNEHSLAGGEEEGGGAWGGSKRGTSQTSTHLLEGRKREERLGELRNVARHKRALTSWRGGRGRSGLVSFESWHVTNEHSLPGGEEEGETAWWDSNHRTSQKSTLCLERRKSGGTSG